MPRWRCSRNCSETVSASVPRPSLWHRCVMSAQYRSASAPPKTFQLISTELSAGIFAGAGTDSSASDRHRAHLLRTFQFLIPVSRFERVSWSFARCDSLIVSSDIADLPPEVAVDDPCSAGGVVVLQLIATADRRFEGGEKRLVDFLVGGKKDHLVARVREVALHDVLPVLAVEASEGRVDHHRQA